MAVSSPLLMQRYRAYFPKDEVPRQEGDDRFVGINLTTDPAELPPGYAADGRNARFRNRRATQRRGVTKPGWLHRLTSWTDAAGRSAPFFRPLGTQGYGVCAFKDPNSAPWVILAAGGNIYRCREGNAPFALALPTGVSVEMDCGLVQAFNKIWLFRNRHFAPLVMNSLDEGFTDVVAHWDAAATYAEGDLVAYGPWQGVDTISAGPASTVVTTNPHGYVSKADVVFRGATPSGYNLRANIQVIDEETFAVRTIDGGAVTGTVEVSNQSYYWEAKGGADLPAAGESPTTHPGKWTQVFDVIPNARTAFYHNGRLLVPTAYTPGNTTYDDDSVYTKTDFLVATEAQNQTRFFFSDELRINQGSDDEIVDVAPGSDDAVVVFKDRSWGILSGVAIDMANARYDQRETGYGLSAVRAHCRAGKNLYFMAGRRGVVSLTQTEQGKVQSVDIPFSAEIQPIIDRIDWRLAGKIRLAAWDNKLYVAVPLDGGNIRGEDVYAAPGPLSLVAGQRYRLRPGGGDGFDFLNGGAIQASYPDGTGDDLIFTATAAVEIGTNGATTETGILLNIWPELVGVNNAILVYDFLNQAWSSLDTGSAFCVKEFFLFPYNGVERLFFLAENGWVNLMEERWHGDMVEGNNLGDGLQLAPFDWLLDTRGYKAGTSGLKRWKEMEAVYQTWNPRFSIALLTEGVGEVSALVADKTKSRTRYTRPHTAAPYDPTNVNDDFARPHREDYSVLVPEAGLYVHDGIPFEEMQDWTSKLRALGQGRSVQFRFTNNQGRFDLASVLAQGQDGPRSQGERT